MSVEMRITKGTAWKCVVCGDNGPLYHHANEGVLRGGFAVHVARNHPEHLRRGTND